MKRKRISEEQIIGVLLQAEAEAGVAVNELARRTGVSARTIFPAAA